MTNTMVRTTLVNCVEGMTTTIGNLIATYYMSVEGNALNGRSCETDTIRTTSNKRKVYRMVRVIVLFLWCFFTCKNEVLFTVHFLVFLIFLCRC